jgi:hypothetical protein
LLISNGKHVAAPKLVSLKNFAATIGDLKRSFEVSFVSMKLALRKRMINDFFPMTAR